MDSIQHTNRNTSHAAGHRLVSAANSVLSARPALAPVQSIAIASGKGGAGKSTVAANLAAALARHEHEVLLLDGDLALGNLGCLFDIAPEATLADALFGGFELGEIPVAIGDGLSLLPSANGVKEMAALSQIEHTALIASFSQLPVAADTLIVDLASGLTPGVLGFAGATREVLLLVGEEPAALQDAASMIAMLHEMYRVQRFRVVANRVSSTRDGLDTYAALSMTIDPGLDVLLDYCGSIPEDDAIHDAAMQRRLVIDAFPRSA
ncbi:MAG: hypothetical protein CSA54_05625, partial [Gammaproteobacteria bacterium]